MEYIIYTDGSCYPNPDGVGGWAYKIIADNEVLYGYGGDNFTTSNRMELTAIIKALEIIPRKSKVEIFSDSKYCVNSISTWIWGWAKYDFAGKANSDLMRQLYNLICDIDVTINWVKGHNGDKHNEEVDHLAEQARIEFEEYEIERLTNNGTFF